LEKQFLLKIKGKRRLVDKSWAKGATKAIGHITTHKQKHKHNHTQNTSGPHTPNEFCQGQ
jgi:hypothetical protein